MADVLSFFLVLFPFLLVYVFYKAYKFAAKADADFHLLRHSLKPEFFKGKVVWITGASSGIGEELCKQLSPLGAKIILSARSKDKLEVIAKGLAHPENSRVLAFDMLDKDSFSIIANKARILFGRIDILVNNAGVWAISKFMNFQEEPSRRLFEINFLNTVLLTKSVIKVMLDQRTTPTGGDIVSIASVSGKGGGFKRHYYGASKAALLSMMDSLRIDFSDDDINFINILPGPVKTSVSLNALTGDGSKHGYMDPAINQGMEVGRCCKLILVAMSNQLKESWISAHPQLYRTYLSQYAPSIQTMLAMHRK